MPWKIDENGERVYKVSKYAKEELPTWNEVYNDFYHGMFLQNDIMYSEINRSDNDVIDPYWKIPRKKFLLATVCNQFNKMLCEDGYEQMLVDHINTSSIYGIRDTDVCRNVRFDLQDIEVGQKYFDSFPIIFTIKHPNGIKNPFIVNDLPRIEVSSITNIIHIHPQLNIVPKDPNGSSKLTRNYYEITDEMCRDCIKFMMQPFNRYFEGADVPGWKDENGNLVETPPVSHVIGYDPAL